MGQTRVAFYGFVGVVAIIWVAIGYWVYADARSRNVKLATLWGIVSAIFWPAGVYYLIRHHRTRKQATTDMRGSRLAKLLGVSGIVSVFTAGVLSSPDVVMMALYLFILFPTVVMLFHFASEQYRTVRYR